MHIVDYDTLKNLFGGQTIEDVKVRMKNAQVKYLVGKRGQPFTTIDAVNSAMGIDGRDNSNEKTIDIEVL